MRLKTLPAAIAPVWVGSALAVDAEGFRWQPAVICLLFALLIQIATNFANDYYDFKKGADTEERVGPKRAVAAGLIKPETMKIATGITFAVAFAVGCLLIPFGGWWLLVVGVASVVCGYAYTAGPYPLAYVGLGDVFVMLFFGLVAVCCTFYVQTLDLTPHVVWMALAVGGLSTNLLVVNNHRDADTDVKANKRTLAVRLGRGFVLWEFRLFILFAYFVCLHDLYYYQIMGFILLPLLTLPLGAKLWFGLGRARSRKDYDKLLGQTAGMLILWSVLLSVGLVL